ncbi:MAG: PAS domain S-box protein [Leptospiraceae bacterium]|nr:PAS domain S-box protein [Leptospiraceae bacterium]
MFILALLLSLFSFGILADSRIQYSNPKEYLYIGKNTKYFIDSENLNDPSIILHPDFSKNFQPIGQDIFSAPPTQSSVWFKFTSENLSGEDLILEFGSIFAWEIDFYAPDESGHYGSPIQTGSLSSKDTKIYDVNLYWFPLNKANEQKEKSYYIRVKSEVPLKIPLAVGTISSLYKNKEYNDFLTAAFIGGVFIILLYNLFIAISTRDKSFVLYLFYLFYSTIDTPFFNNYPFIADITQDYIDKNFWYRYFIVWQTPIYLIVTLFNIQYLKIRENFPFIAYYCYTILFLISFVLPVLNLTIFSMFDLVELFEILSFLHPLSFFLIGLFLEYKKDKMARIFTIGWFLLLAGVIIYIGTLNGLIPYNRFTDHSIYYGTVGELIMFSFAIGHRLNELKTENQKVALENYKLITLQKEELKLEISKQTSELQKKTNELELLFRNNQAIMSSLNRSLLVSISDLEGKLIHINPIFCETTGYRSEELIGKNYDLLNSGYHTHSFWSHLKKTIQSGNVWNGEIKNKKSDGSYFWVDSITSAIFNEKNEIINYLTIQYNITDRKNYEQLIEDQKDKLSSSLIEIDKAREEAILANSAKSKFIAHMSHEIRTPLNIIIGYTEFLISRTGDTEAANHLKNILNSANSLLTILSDILDLSKIESGKLELDIMRINVIEFIGELADFLKVNIYKKNLDFYIYFSPQIPIYIEVDPLRLKQVFMNLLSNAVKFTSEGYIKIHVLPDSEEKILILIEDTGIGITEKQKMNLFQAFSQADNSTTRKFGGTGLGLTISSLIIEKLGSKIQLESNPGKGSIFSFQLPVSTVKMNSYYSPSKLSGITTIHCFEKDQEYQKILKEFCDFMGISLELYSDFETFCRSCNFDRNTIYILNTNELTNEESLTLESFFAELRKPNKTISLILITNPIFSRRDYEKNEQSGLYFLHLPMHFHSLFLLLESISQKLLKPAPEESFQKANTVEPKMEKILKPKTQISESDKNTLIKIHKILSDNLKILKPASLDSVVKDLSLLSNREQFSWLEKEIEEFKITFDEVQMESIVHKFEKEIFIYE